jgi:hypothetical protein
MSRLVEDWIDVLSVFQRWLPGNGERMAMVSRSLTAIMLPDSSELACA